MSSQIPPDPITNTFNPGAWDLPELSTAEQAVLDTKYVKYPTAQNSLITFPSSITTNGVNTNTLDAIAVGSAQTVGSNLTTGSLTLGGAMTNGNITIGRFGQTGTTTVETTLKVNNIAATDPVGGTINIGADQVGGQISLGLAATRTGDINIGNNMAAGIIKVGSFFGATSTATIEVGTPAIGTTSIRGATTSITGTTVGITSTSTLDLALPAASVLNVGVVASRSVVHHYSDGDNPSGAVHINNGTTNNSRTRIHDGTGANLTGIVDIMSSALNSGTINIGAAATTTNITGTLNATGLVGYAKTGSANTFTETNTFNNATAGIKTNTLDATAVDSTMSIGSSIVEGSIVIGSGKNGFGEIQIGSNVTNTRLPGTFKCNKHDGTAESSAVTFGSNLTNGSITIGGSFINTAALTIGQYGYSTPITIYGSVKIQSIQPNYENAASNFATTSTNVVTLGSTSSTSTVVKGGALTLDTLAAGNISIGADQVGGQISLGLLSTRTGDINIGNNMAAGTIKIGNNFGATSTSIIELGTKSKGIVYLRSATLNINDDGTGNTVIGKSGGSNTITLNRPLTIGYAPSDPTLSTQIGFLEQPTVTWSQINFTELARSTLLPIGTYTASVAINTTGTFIPAFIYFTGGTGVSANFRIPAVVNNSSICYTGSYTFRMTTASTLSISIHVNNLQALDTVATPTFDIIRIA
jgi:hypothetical protein